MVHRVSDHPPKPIKAIRTLRDHLDACFTIRSFCSSGQGHSHIVDLQELIAERGLDVEIDYHFKRSLTCPECGAPGRGLEIRER